MLKIVERYVNIIIDDRREWMVYYGNFLFWVTILSIIIMVGTFFYREKIINSFITIDVERRNEHEQ